MRDLVILILFHSGGFRCFQALLQGVCLKHLKHLFPRQVSYNRFVELREGSIASHDHIHQKVLLGTCTGISFVDSTPLCVCRNQDLDS